MTSRKKTRKVLSDRALELVMLNVLGDLHRPSRAGEENASTSAVSTPAAAEEECRTKHATEPGSSRSDSPVRDPKLNS